MDMERLVPSRDEELKRFSVILQLKKVGFDFSGEIISFLHPIVMSPPFFCEMLKGRGFVWFQFSISLIKATLSFIWEHKKSHTPFAWG